MSDNNDNNPISEDEAKAMLAGAIMEYAQKRDDMFLDSFLNPPPEAQSVMTSMAGELPGGDYLGGFASAMVCQELLRREEAIIRSEWYESLGKTIMETSEHSIQRYVEARTKAEAKYGLDALKLMMERAREEHNECARSNLDNNEGRTYSWVLPEFESDGSHGPVGDRDVPWGTLDED